MPTSRKTKVIIIGAGGHGRVVERILKYNKSYKILGFLDDDTNKSDFDILGETGDFRKFLKSRVKFSVAVGDNKTRAKFFKMILEKGGVFVNAIHPCAVVEKGVDVGQNVMIGAFSYINIGSKIGNNTIINNGCIVEHHNIIGDHCHLTPGVVTAGNVKIEDYVWVGLGSTIKDGLKISQNSFIGAGSNVVKNTEPNSLYYGNPAKLIRKLS